MQRNTYKCKNVVLQARRYGRSTAGFSGLVIGIFIFGFEFSIVVGTFLKVEQLRTEKK